MECSGYYTYDQIVDALMYAKEDSKCAEFIDELIEIREEMDLYNLKIMDACRLIHWENWEKTMVKFYKIIPTQFVYTTNRTSSETAPNFRRVDSCGTCKHNEPDYDCGKCKKHVTIYHVYSPELKTPLSVFCNMICDDFERDEECGG